ncbi:MAG TPA: adenylate/guanylate cyclase domain-containing protein [Solirubrobacteraceae bacterium]|nr:adenylate/guanylate cyclase domain-containing protein [Solirubrobacteraceae bacterium]
MTSAGPRALLAAFLDSERDEQSGRELSRAASLILTTALVITNLVGAAIVLAVIYLVLPLPPVHDASQLRRLNAIVAAVYIVSAVPVGAFAGRALLRGLADWLVDDRPADTGIQHLVVRAPLFLFRLQFGLWLVAAVVFGVIDSLHAVRLGLVVAATVALTGVTTAACAYLLAERILRKPASRALADEDPGHLRVPGVATRAVLAWAFGTGVPVLGTVMVGIAAAAGSPATDRQLERVMIVLGVIAVLVGLLAVMLAARATADPIEAVRRAMERVQAGDFDERVPIYDGTQIGRLQLGFNRMAAGLAERERIRTTFGSYVDEDVAERILAGDVELGGEEVDVTIMFLDVRGFTAFAERTEARDVVTALNRLFEQVIPVIHEHGGRVDKFVGDGLLAVFGTPKRLDDHADAALDAARAILDGLGEDEPLEVGIGINSGRVVAGNLGAAGRLEYGVIGDPVNVAARVQAHTRETGDALLITAEVCERLSRPPDDLHEREGVTLRGRQEPITLYGL